MNLLILGHSYVRDLKSLNQHSLKYDQQEILISYSSYPGATFDTFLKDSSKLSDPLRQYKPDIIVVVLGGNDINRDVTNHELFKKCREFYELLRGLAADAIIIAAQVESRFYKTPNVHSAPAPVEFQQKRKTLNKFIHRLKTKDNLLIIAGPGRLDHQTYYRDSVHLNSAGLRNYMSILKTTIDFALGAAKRR